jgi:hypothetical protein
MQRLSSQLVLREKESELLFRGEAYRQAIASYYYAIPSRPELPRRLADLEKDPRFLLKRHIRHLYPEPMAGEWRLLTDGQGRVVGVASTSAQMPLKTANFPMQFSEFEAAAQYSEWRFVFQPGQ